MQTAVCSGDCIMDSPPGIGAPALSALARQVGSRKLSHVLGGFFGQGWNADIRAMRTADYNRADSKGFLRPRV